MRDNALVSPIIADPGDSSPDALLAERYGRRPRNPARRRLALWVTLATFVVVAVVFIGWASLARVRGDVDVVDMGMSDVRTDSATFTFQVTVPPGVPVVCTVRAINVALLEVGRTDVELAATPTGRTKTSVTVRTVERAEGGGVKSCVRR